MVCNLNSSGWAYPPGGYHFSIFQEVLVLAHLPGVHATQATWNAKICMGRENTACVSQTARQGREVDFTPTRSMPTRKPHHFSLQRRLRARKGYAGPCLDSRQI